MGKCSSASQEQLTEVPGELLSFVSSLDHFDNITSWGMLYTLKDKIKRPHNKILTNYSGRKRENKSENLLMDLQDLIKITGIQNKTILPQSVVTCI